jgi:hypothetical protein
MSEEKKPETLAMLVEKIDHHHEQRESIDRPHLGCSTLGHPCDRKIWLDFRWAFDEEIPGRVLRLFRRGQYEEAVVVADLRAIGVEVRHTGASQYRVSFGGHISGSVDGIVSRVPSKGGAEAVLEIKTHNSASFKDLQKNGVEKSKFQHYVQCQLYMLGAKKQFALYVAVNKDNDELYVEWIEVNYFVANQYLDRGNRLAISERMPEPLSTDPTWYQCKMCNHHRFCHSPEMRKLNGQETSKETPRKEETPSGKLFSK